MPKGRGGGAAVALRSSSDPPARRASQSPPPPPLGVVELGRNARFSIRYAPAHRLLLLTRSAQPFESIEQLRSDGEWVLSALVRVPRSGVRLLLDSRRSPARNDPEFEQALASFRQQLFRSFTRVSVLMQSAAGVLQAMRHARDDGLATCAFMQPREALMHLGLPLRDELLKALDDGAEPR
jgi:hypothetical protein